MRIVYIALLLLFAALDVSGKTYFIAIEGSDSAAGTKDSPFASIAMAQSAAEPGDTVFIRGGTYRMREDQIMSVQESVYACMFYMNKSGAGADKRIFYWGYEGERPVFDMSDVKPDGMRVSVFYVAGSYLHFKNFDITGTQVTIVGHTQSECLSNRGGSHNIYENIAMHDGMAIGFYLTKGSDNLVLNCDAYNNYDPVSDGSYGGNVDGFGAHPSSAAYTGNVFRGCRAWYNSDDGFDLINAHAPVSIDNCWSFYNGFKPDSFDSAGDGTGFKAGGYGMSDSPKVPETIPVHSVTYSLAYFNKTKGFYSNHHLGGINWEYNSGYMNPSNFCMLNRKSAAEAVDVDGYGHMIENNLSYEPRTEGKHLIDCNVSLCRISNNSFAPSEWKLNGSDFVSLDASELILPRNADGSLPDIGFLKLSSGSILFTAGIGYSIGHGWMLSPSIVAEGNIARVLGPGATDFTRFYVDGREVAASGNTVDLTPYKGTVEIKALSDSGGITKITVEL